MKSRPIIFSATGVRAILDGRKTQTRRLIKLHKNAASVLAEVGDTAVCRWEWGSEDGRGSLCCLCDCRTLSIPLRCPHGVAGDRLWVREAWAVQHAFDGFKPSEINWDARWHYAATEERGGLLWRSPLHMPRWASRIELEITDVRVQRLQEISEEDARAEGARFFKDIPNPRPHTYGQDARWSMADPKSTDECLGTARYAFANAWNKLHGDGAWDENLRVWCLSFRRVESEMSSQS